METQHFLFEEIVDTQAIVCVLFSFLISTYFPRWQKVQFIYMLGEELVPGKAGDRKKRKGWLEVEQSSWEMWKDGIQRYWLCLEAWVGPGIPLEWEEWQWRDDRPLDSTLKYLGQEAEISADGCGGFSGVGDGGCCCWRWGCYSPRRWCVFQPFSLSFFVI